MHVFLGFKKGKLITIILSTENEVENATDVNYYIADPQNVEEQINKWKQEHA